MGKDFEESSAVFMKMKISDTVTAMLTSTPALWVQMMWSLKTSVCCLMKL